MSSQMIGTTTLRRFLNGATLAMVASVLGPGPTRAEEPAPRPGDRLTRRGDEIVVCGQFYHTTAPVVLWLDPGGYDAYRLERRFVPREQALSPVPERPGKPLASRFGQRQKGLSEAEQERVRGGGWDLPLLQKSIDQFVLHFDARGTSRRCFEVLHDLRGLSVHFMLDLDGTIYQTLDVKEAAWHATVTNGRSIGIEIANIGAYAPDQSSLLERWYQRDESGQVRLAIPDPPERSGLREASAVLRPARREAVLGSIQGKALRQYDFTDRQYESLARLTATLCTLFPKIRCDYPRDGSGELVRVKLADPVLRQYEGILGHYHVQTNKVDPGPAFQWDRLISESRARLGR